VFGSDCNSTDDPKLHEAKLATLRRGFARIMSGHEIIGALAKSAPGRSISAAVPVTGN
jgi:hypothetical protein